MNRGKLILLTVLIILVLYCGAIIFLTRPDGVSFTYEFLFGNQESQPVADVFVQDSDAAIQPAVTQPEAIQPVATEISATVESAAEVAVTAQPVEENPVVVPEVAEAEISGITDAVEAEVSDITDAVAEPAVVSEDILEDVEGVRFTVSDSPVEISAEEYNRTRTTMRNSEIDSLLSSLKDE